ncbi:hypothetical protein SDC9_129930 [bioreactor metagenome]|uniref:Uncharacterized protein n=1 Tax=bioreactor metagenome TaxID=1076179 RepID=A0A645D170_9ZZZZ
MLLLIQSPLSVIEPRPAMEPLLVMSSETTAAEVVANSSTIPPVLFSTLPATVTVVFPEMLSPPLLVSTDCPLAQITATTVKAAVSISEKAKG